MTDSWIETPLGGWAARRPTAQVVDLAAHRGSSVRWRLVIEPRAIDALEKFDRMVGLEPSPPVTQLDELRLRKRA